VAVLDLRVAGSGQYRGVGILKCTAHRALVYLLEAAVFIDDAAQVDEDKASKAVPAAITSPASVMTPVVASPSIWLFSPQS
jgi:hypothetical protein